MSIKSNIQEIKNELPSTTKLVAVSKFKSEEEIFQAYFAGQRVFGESRPQELLRKVESMPKDIEWHFIGHLQTNKLKMVLPYVKLLHSVDSVRLLKAIEDYCVKNNQTIDILLEVFIAQEESKQGFLPEELFALLDSIGSEIKLTKVNIKGLMGMASFVEDPELINEEFGLLVSTFDEVKSRNYPFLTDFTEKSFGMSGDYKIAMNMGSTMVRVGTAIFGAREEII